MKQCMSIMAATLCLIGIAVGIIHWQNHHEIKHIVLISIDTCRADHLSCYGYPKKTTPNIDAFAQQATRFKTVVTPAPITFPAHSSMLTGRIPPAHGVHNNIGYQLDPSNTTLAELLKKDGFTTGAIVSSFVLNGKLGLNQGFDTYYDQFPIVETNPNDSERKGGETTKLAMAWLDKNKDDNKSFLFLHYYDAHADYAPPKPYKTQFAGNLYAGEIAFVDHCIGQVIQKLKDTGQYNSTLLIVTGDHGEMLGEHGEDEHSYFVYESAIKVPLIIKLPGQKKGNTIAPPVGLIDIVPTICSLMKIDPPADIQGRDISPMLHGKVPEGYQRCLYSESDTPTQLGASSLMAISTGTWKYIQAPRPELYNIATDPQEAHNLVQQEPQRARILKDKLKQTLDESVRTGGKNNQTILDAESIRRLESLGYIAGKTEGEMVFDQNKDDPKDLIKVFAPFQRARTLIRHREYAKAKSILESLIPLRPSFHQIYIQLGDIAGFQGRFNDAVKEYRRANKANPNDPAVWNNLAWLQATRPSLASRNVDEAVTLATKLCEHSHYRDPSALDTLAVCYAAGGNFNKAVETEKKAYALTPKETMLARQIAARLQLFRKSHPYIEENLLR